MKPRNSNRDDGNRKGKNEETGKVPQKEPENAK
jgi:hypothetical protein